MIDACSQAIWQSKVAPDIQGRVFSVRAMIAQSTLPLAYLMPVRWLTLFLSHC